MDTTETYVKMADCPEIQEPERWLLFKPRKLDCIVWSGADVFFDGKDKLIWLPRQDQLQEMILANSPYYHKLRMLYESWIKGLGFEKNFTSMEQLWLAFVMKEKYSKQWNGTNWGMI